MCVTQATVLRWWAPLEDGATNLKHNSSSKYYILMLDYLP